MLTAATTSPTPRALVQPNRSPKTVAPMATAVSGSSAPKIDVSVGPMNLIALTSVMLEIAVAGSASPRIASYSFPSVTSRTPPVNIPPQRNSRAPKAMT